ncbi:MAG TPA: peptide-methionine (S)-S-oxide reductase MsrA [Hyphomicrobiales bacterium]|nr:peptide-methionine (S)-S-oxide reductase MsrA [Hyphomicrobiales bacterium]
MPKTHLIPSLALALATFAAAPALDAAGRLETAVFAGGCFWTVQHDFESIPGVVDTVAGYSGGTEPNPTYDLVSGETTHYLESVKVTFDPAKISYRQLADHYWRMIDPTDAGGQVCDQGPSYHSAIFVASPEQQKDAEASKAAIDNGPRQGKIATVIRAAMPFYPAEAYHQHYADRNPMSYGAYRIGCGRDRRLAVIWRGDKLAAEK